MSCDLTIDGVLDCEGTGTGTGNLSIAVSIGTGRVEVLPPYIQDVEGNYQLDVYGNYQYMESPNFIEDVDGDWMLDVDGKRILFEGSRAQLIGTKTPLSTVAYGCLWVNFTAYSFNYRNLFLAGPSVAYGNRYGEGNLVVPGQTISITSIDDLSKVFIHGYDRDGGYFTFGQSESQYLGGTDGFGLAGTDSQLLGGTGQ